MTFNERDPNPMAVIAYLAMLLFGMMMGVGIGKLALCR